MCLLWQGLYEVFWFDIVFLLCFEKQRCKTPTLELQVLVGLSLVEIYEISC